MSTIKSLRFDISSSWDGTGLAQARAELDDLKRNLDEINGKDIRVNVSIDEAAAQAQIDRLKASLDSLKDVTARVNVNVTGADTARATLDDLARSRTASVNTNLQGAQAARTSLDDVARTRNATVRAQDEGVAAVRAKLDDLARLRRAEVSAKLTGDDVVRRRLDDLIRTRRAEIKADLKDMGVAQRLDLLARDRRVRFIVDADRSKLDDLSKALDDVGKKFQWAQGRAANLATAIIALGPAIIPLSAAVLGLGGAILSAFGSAALAVAPFAASILGTVKSASQLNQTLAPLNTQLNAQKAALATLTPGSKAYSAEQAKIAQTQSQINQAMSQATPVQQQVAQSLSNLSGAWQNFQKQAEKTTGPILSAGFNAVAAAIPKMLPLVQAVGPLFQQIADKANAFANSNGMTKFVDWVIKVGVPNLKNIMDTIGHLFVTIGQLMKAFAPAGESFTKWLSDVTKKLDDWGKNGGFQRFADQVKKDWPQVKALIVAVGDAIKHVIEALNGFGPASLAGLKLLAQTVAKLSPGEIQAVAAGFLAIKVALAGIEAVKGAIAVIQGVGKAIEVVRGIILGLRFAALALDTSLLPLLLTFGLIIAVVVALGVVIFLLITHWKEFSSYISGSFMSAVHAVANFFSGPFTQAFKDFASYISSGFMTAVKAVGSFFSGPFVRFFTDTIPRIAAAIGQWVSGTASAVANFVKSIGDKIGSFFSGPFVRFFTDTIPRMAAAVGRWAAGIAGAVANFVSSIGQKIGAFFSGPFVNFFTQVIPKMAAAVGRWAAGIAGSIANFVSGIGQKIGAFFSGPFVRFFTDAIPHMVSAIGRWLAGIAGSIANFVNGIGQKIGSFFSGPFVRFFTDAIPKMAEAIGRWAAGVAGKIASFFSDLAKDFANGIKAIVAQMLKAGGDIAKSLFDGLKNGIEHNPITDTLGGWAKKGLDGIRKIFKWFSPAGVTVDLGADLNHGLAQGVNGNIGVSLAAFTQMGIKSINALKQSFTSMQQVGMQAMQLLITGVQFGMASLLNIVQAFGPRMSAAFTTAFQASKTSVTQAMTEMTASVRTGMTQMQQEITSATQQMKTTWTTFVNTFKTAWTTASNALKSDWQNTWNQLKTTSQTAWNSIKTAWTTFVNTFKTAWTTASNALKTQWTATWNALKTSSQTVWNAIKTAWTTFTKTFQTAWTAASNALKTAWTASWNALKTSAQTVWDSIKTAWTTFLNAIKTAYDTAAAALKAAWTADWNAIKTAGQTVWDAMKAAWQKFNDDIQQIWKTTSAALTTAWDFSVFHVLSHAQSAWDQIKNVIQTACNTIKGIIQDLINAWNTVAGAVGLPNIPSIGGGSSGGGGSASGASSGTVAGGAANGGATAGGRAAPGSPATFSKGGVFPGYAPGVDSIPAMYSPGEGVLVPEAVRGLGEGFVHGANHFFSGGRAGYKTPHFDEGGVYHFATGGVVGGTSGSAGLTGAFGLPDPAKVTAMFNQIIDHARGLSGTLLHPMGMKAADYGSQMLQKLIAAIQAKIAAMQAAAAAAAGLKGLTGGVSGTVGNLVALASKALAAAGLPQSELGAFLRLIQAESSGNPNAINLTDINARAGNPSVGLAQVTLSNFAKYGPGGNPYDPLGNLIASANYSKAVYGGIPNHSPYARGTDSATPGWHLVGEEGPEIVSFGGGESVMNNKDTMNALKGGRGGDIYVNCPIDARGATPEAVQQLKQDVIPKLRMAIQAGVGKRGH